MSESDGAAASWLDATARPAASPPETDQPAAPAPGASTGSLNATCMVSSETAVAPSAEGDWPSDSTVGIAASSSRMPRPDSTAEPLISMLPVAFGGAPPGENVRVWRWPSAPPPSRPVMFLGCPATTSDE